MSSDELAEAWDMVMRHLAANTTEPRPFALFLAEYERRQRIVAAADRQDDDPTGRDDECTYLDRRQAVADAGRALLRSGGAYEDWEALRVALYELDGEPVNSDADPAPVPARVLLPAPDGVGPSDINTVRCAWWRVSSTGEQVLFAEPGQVYYLDAYTSTDLNAIERDALATLAAVHWARSGT